MKVRFLKSILMSLTFALFAFIAAPVLAGGNTSTKAEPGTIASVWLLWVTPGKDKEFEAALKQYAAWRKSTGEGFNWSIYQPIVGEDLTYFAVRSDEHHWKDFDANAAWEAKNKAGDAYNEQVGPYTARVEHYFTETDSAHSHWIDSKDYKYFSVTRYYTKSGTYGERTDALNKIRKAAVDEKWPYPYDIRNLIGGKEPMQVVIPMKSYADMADPDPSLMKILAKSLGSDAEAAATMKQFGSTIDHTTNTIYEYRPDLSTPK